MAKHGRVLRMGALPKFGPSFTTTQAHPSLGISNEVSDMLYQSISPQHLRRRFATQLKGSAKHFELSVGGGNGAFSPPPSASDVYFDVMLWMDEVKRSMVIIGVVSKSHTRKSLAWWIGEPFPRYLCGEAFMLQAWRAISEGEIRPRPRGHWRA
jgi:hypothetical protein